MNAPIPRPPAVASFDAGRQRFLVALMTFLTDPSVGAEAKAGEVEATNSAIAQLLYLAGAEG